METQGAMYFIGALLAIWMGAPSIITFVFKGLIFQSEEDHEEENQPPHENEFKKSA